MAINADFKTRKLSAGIYEIVGTKLTIEKGEPPRYGEPQEWFVMRGHDIVLVGKSKQGCEWSVQTILLEFNREG